MSKKPIADPVDVSDWIKKMAPLVKKVLKEEKKKSTQKYYLRPGPKTDKDMTDLANKGIEK